MAEPLGKCSYCGNPLIMEGSRCRFCGEKATWREQRKGRATMTRRGAQKVLKKDLERQQQSAYADVESHPQQPDVRESYLMTWQQAEMLVCEWMRRHGYRDARLTESGADGGIDITSRKAIAQVKHHVKPVGIAEIQRLQGIATAEKKQALFYSFAGYTPKAREWAKQNGVRLYRYPPVDAVD